MLEKLFAEFDSVVVLDTETTGVKSKDDEIIELGFLRLDRDGTRTEEDYLIRLTPGKTIPPFIADLTHITDDMLAEKGVEKTVAAEALVKALSSEHPLVCAYNAQFDLCFIFYFLARLGLSDALKPAKFLDIMAVYKDRRDYPHKLVNAVEEYRVTGENTHRASDDAAAALEVLAAMERERDDIDRYVNLFGYNPKYGVPKPSISSVRYEPQPFRRTKLLYE